MLLLGFQWYHNSVEFLNMLLIHLDNKRIDEQCKVIQWNRCLLMCHLGLLFENQLMQWTMQLLFGQMKHPISLQSSRKVLSPFCKSQQACAMSVEHASRQQEAWDYTATVRLPQQWIVRSNLEGSMEAENWKPLTLFDLHSIRWHAPPAQIIFYPLYAVTLFWV